MNPLAPAPTPPWARRVQSPLVQNLFSTAVPIALDPEVIYLSQNQAQGSPIENDMTLPNGDFLQRILRIYVPGNYIGATATWVLSGTFAGGFTKLTFNATGYSAMLEWDGTAWQLVGGNAQLSP